VPETDVECDEVMLMESACSREAESRKTIVRDVLGQHRSSSRIREES
jgi:hypothetical protein